MNSPRFCCTLLLLPLSFLFLCGPISASVDRNHLAVIHLDSSPIEEATEFAKPETIPIAGTLVYDFDLPIEGGVIDSLFVLDPIAPHAKVGEHREIYRPNGYALFSAFDASPDGQHVLIKVGRMIDPGENLIYFLWHKNDRVPYQTNNIPKNARYILQAPPGNIFNLETHWSPDGRYLAYFPGVISGSKGLSPAISSSFSIYDVANDSLLKLDRLKMPVIFNGWTPRGTLIGIGPYARLRQTDPQSNPDQENFIAARHSSLYEFSLSRQTPQLVVQNAFGKASVTADGRWVIYQGWADLEHPEEEKKQETETNNDKYPNAGTELGKPNRLSLKPTVKTTQRGLYQFDTQAKKRYPVALPGDIGPFMFDRQGVDDLRWAPDGKRALLRLRNGLYVIDGATRLMTLLTVLTTTHGQPDEAGQMPLCEVLGFSDDSQFVIMRVSPDIEWKIEGYWPWADVRAVNLNDGKVAQIARIKRARGVSWISKNSPPAVSLTPKAANAQAAIHREWDSILDKIGPAPSGGRIPSKSTKRRSGSSERR